MNLPMEVSFNGIGSIVEHAVPASQAEHAVRNSSHQVRLLICYYY